MVIWFGIGETSKIILLFLAIFAPVALAARAGVRSVSQEQIQAARSMGALPRQVVLHVIAPGALPEILVGLRIGMGVGWTTLVAAEMVAADAGLGKMVFNAANFLRTDVVMLGTIVIGIVAFAFEMLMRWVEKARRAVEGQGVARGGREIGGVRTRYAPSANAQRPPRRSLPVPCRRTPPRPLADEARALRRRTSYADLGEAVLARS